MALEKIEVIDSMNVLEDGQIQVRRATKIMEDGKELSRANHRKVIAPTDDVSGEDAETQAIAAIVQTQERKNKYQAKLDKDKPKEVTNDPID